MKTAGVEELNTRQSSPETASEENIHVPRSDRKSASNSPGKGSAGKVVRNSFTMLEEEYALIERIRYLCLKKMMVVNRSEVLRAGVQLLNALPEKEIIARIKALPKVKAGRPPIE